MTTELTNSISWECQEKEIQIIGQDSKIEGFKALIRSDNNEVLSIHKKSYAKFDNNQIEKITEEIAKLSGGSVQGFTEFQKGKRILGFVKPSDNIQTIGKNPIEDYIVIGNSHDGSTGIFLGTSTTLIRCTNAFSRIVKDNVIRHTKNHESYLYDVVRTYSDYKKEKEILYQSFENMSKIHIDKDIILSLQNRIFNVNNLEEISAKKEDQIKLFNESLEREFTDLGQNLWGFFNAVTHYSTHSIKQKQSTFGNVFGTSAEFNKKSIKIIEELTLA